MMAPLPAGPPLLQVVVDTEEEFDWDRPFDRRNVGVTAIGAQATAQALFSPYGLRPTYVIDYPVATTPSSIAVLKGFLDAGQCQIGAHLHPWVNPPYEEEVSEANSYPGNLPAPLESAKLLALTRAIGTAFGIQPTIYKAGRYGIGANTAGILRGLGFRIDLSVVPHTDFSRQSGPDFRGWPDRPYWLDQTRLELPRSRGFCGGAAATGPAVFTFIESDWARSLHLGGLLARSRLLERVTLTPEGVEFAAMKRLVHAMLRRGHRLFTLTYHSPSLAPGHTPYVRSERDLSVFLDRIRRVLALFFDELAAQPTTPEEVYAVVRG